MSVLHMFVLAVVTNDATMLARDTYLCITILLAMLKSTNYVEAQAEMTQSFADSTPSQSIESYEDLALLRFPFVETLQFCVTC